MFGDKPVTTLFEICVEKTMERFGNIDREAANRINHDLYVDDLITGGTAGNGHLDRLNHRYNGLRQL